MLLVGRIPLGRGFLRELRRTWKSLRVIWNPKAAHPAKAAARPLAVRRGLNTWLRRFSPPRWVTLTLLVAYVGGYVVLRRMRLLSFDYPVEVLDNYMRIRNGDPTITTLGHWKPDQGNILVVGNIPVAEAPWWGLRLIDAGADARIQWGPPLFSLPAGPDGRWEWSKEVVHYPGFPIRRRTGNGVIGRLLNGVKRYDERTRSGCPPL